VHINQFRAVKNSFKQAVLELLKNNPLLFDETALKYDRICGISSGKKKSYILIHRNRKQKKGEGYPLLIT
jgi:hypothetical protein